MSLMHWDFSLDSSDDDDDFAARHARLVERVRTEEARIDAVERRAECKTHEDARVIALLHLGRMQAEKVYHLDEVLRDFGSACRLQESIYRNASTASSKRVCELLFKGNCPDPRHPELWNVAPPVPPIAVPCPSPPAVSPATVAAPCLT